MAARLCFRGVGVTIGDAAILDGVSLDLGQPGVTVVAGPSGSGKSTLLRCANRLEAPTGGTIELDGVDTATVPATELRRRVGMVFQRPVPFAGTVRDNLVVAAPGADDGVLRAVLARVALDDTFLDRQADDLSGGEAQRMCIARALLTGPDLLLMDEPTSALDVDARQAIEALARTLADAGTPIVWVTHDLDQAERIGDRVVVVKDGRVVPDDEAARYVAARSFGPDQGPGA